MLIDDFRPANKTGASDNVPPPIEPPAEEQTPTPEPKQPEPAETKADPVTPVFREPAPAHDSTKAAKQPKSKFHLTGKQWVIIAAVVVLLGAGGGYWALVYHKKPVPAIKTTTKKTLSTVATPTTVPSDLDGLPVPPSANKIPVTAVMVENSTFARPQAGLSAAGVVFEAVAEGGVTRFMALYQDTAPTNVGPIRSVRPYYEQWALGFDAAIAHVGGSPDALADITAWNVKNLDEFSNGSYYHRITTRQAPHNVYTGINTLNQLEAVKGYTTSTYTPFPRKADQPAKSPTAGAIALTMSGPDYDVAYQYDPTNDSYLRSEGGAAQTDSNTNTQLDPKVVIAMVIPETNGALDSSGAYYSDYQDIGSGAVYVFQDGTVTTGTWTKSSNASQITFAAADGKPIKLNAGQTWLTAVTTSANVSYSP